MSPPAAARSSCHRSAGRPLWLSHPWHALSATRDRMPTMHGSPALRGLACRGAPVHEPVPRDQPPSALRTVLGGPCLSAIPAPHGRSRAWLPPGCRMAAWALLRKAQLECIGVDLQRRVVRNNQDHTGPAAQGPASAGRRQRPGTARLAAVARRTRPDSVDVVGHGRVGGRPETARPAMLRRRMARPETSRPAVARRDRVRARPGAPSRAYQRGACRAAGSVRTTSGPDRRHYADAATDGEHGAAGADALGPARILGGLITCPG